MSSESKPWPVPWSQPVGKQALVTTVANKYEIDTAEVVQLVPKSETKVGQQAPWRWEKGVSGNPKGRPKGTKHKITEMARAIFAEDFHKHGAETLARVRAIDPVAYLQLVLKLIPRELILQREKGLTIDYAELSEEDFIEAFEAEMKRRKLAKMMQAAGPVL